MFTLRQCSYQFDNEVLNCFISLQNRAYKFIMRHMIQYHLFDIKGYHGNKLLKLYVQILSIMR